jgi:hypothetical protein
MDIGGPEKGQGRKNENADSQMQLENLEEAPRVNGMAPNQETIVEPKESQTTMSEHPQEGEVEDVTRWRNNMSKNDQ